MLNRSYCYNIMDRMSVELYKPNGTLEFTEYPIGYLAENYSMSGTKVTAQIKVTTQPDGTLTIVNPTGRGYAQAMGNSGGARFYPREWTAKMKDGVMVFDLGQNVAVGHNQGLSSYNTRGTSRQLRLAVLPNFPSTAGAIFDNDKATITGTITKSGGIEHRQGSSNTFWVNPGDCRTFVLGVEGTFSGMYAGVYSSGGVTQSTPAWGNFKFTLGEVDVTLDADIVGGTLGVNDDYLWPQMVFQVNGNDTYVDSYELYMISAAAVGQMHPSKGGEDFKNENGFTNAFLVTSVSADELKPIGNDPYPKQIIMNRLFKKSEMKADQLDPNNKYYFFVKAIYKENIQTTAAKAADGPMKAGSSILDGTFHGFFSEPEVTGTESIIFSNLDVKAGQGQLTITGSRGNVTVYSVEGRVVYRGGDATVSVPRGVYIATGDAKTVKVYVP